MQNNSGHSLMKRRFALTSLLNVIGLGLSFVASLVITPLMLRSLGQEAYGVWVLVTAFSVVSGYLSLLDLGVQSAIVKFVAKHYARQEFEKINQIFSVGLYLFGGLGLLGAVALVLFAQIFLTSMFNIPLSLVGVTRLMFFLLAVQILFEFPGLIFSAVMDGMQRYDLQRIIMIAYVILFSGVLVTLLLCGYGLLALSLTMLVLAVLKVMVLVIVLLCLMPGLKLVRKFDLGLMRRVANFSWQIFLVRINAVIYNTMDKTIIGVVLNTTQLTGYDIANKLRNISMAPLSLITPQIVPSASTLHGAGDKMRLQELFLKGTKYQMAIAVPVIVTVLVLAERFIRVWIGPEYIYTANLARLFVVSVFIDAMIAVGQRMLIGIGRVKPIIWISFVSVTVNLVFSVILTLKFGVAGVLWGTLIGLAICVVPYFWLFFNSFNLSLAHFWNKVLWPTYSVAAVLVVLLYYAETLLAPKNLLSLAGLTGGCLAIYGLLYSIYSLDSAERKILLQAIGFRL